MGIKKNFHEKHIKSVDFTQFILRRNYFSLISLIIDFYVFTHRISAPIIIFVNFVTGINDEIKIYGVQFKAKNESLKINNLPTI